MRQYRVYRVNGSGGIENAEWLEADDDEQAIQLAVELSGGLKCEVWERDRLVASLMDRTEGRQA